MVIAMQELTWKSCALLLTQQQPEMEYLLGEDKCI